MKKIVIVLMVFLSLYSCMRSSSTKENVFKVSEGYCDCLQKQFNRAEDSSVNLNDCMILTYSKSRLLSIYANSDNWKNHNENTLDSAKNFTTEFGRVIDSICYKRIDFKKVKKIRHV